MKKKKKINPIHHFHLCCFHSPKMILFSLLISFEVWTTQLAMLLRETNELWQEEWWSLPFAWPFQETVSATLENGQLNISVEHYRNIDNNKLLFLVMAVKPLLLSGKVVGNPVGRQEDIYFAGSLQIDPPLFVVDWPFSVPDTILGNIIVVVVFFVWKKAHKRRHANLLHVRGYI